MTETNLELIENHRARSVTVVSGALTGLAETISECANAMIDCLAAGGRVLCCGNGGSASDALHFSSELINRYVDDRQPLAAICLNADVSTLTSIANDYGYDDVFSKQVEAFGRPGDMLLAITTSGHSSNILAAQKAAQTGGLGTVLLTGRDGGESLRICRNGDFVLRVEDDITAHIQEAHGAIIHCICALIERHFVNLVETN